MFLLDDYNERKKNMMYESKTSEYENVGVLLQVPRKFWGFSDNQTYKISERILLLNRKLSYGSA